MPEVREFALPDLGEGLTEAEIVRWLVEVGDVVAVDQPVVEVETAKAMVEVPCPYAGVVTARYGEPGTEVPVGAALVTVAVGLPAADAVAGRGGRGGRGTGARDEAAAAATHAGETTGGSGNVLVGYGTSTAAARRRRTRRPGGVTAPGGGASAGAAESVHGGGRPAGGGAAPERSAPPSAETESAGPVHAGPVAVISPLVRRIAREHGLDLRTIDGTGPEGLILRADVERAIRTAAAVPAAPAAAAPTEPVAPGGAPAAPVPAGAERVPLRGVRGAVADKLARSRREIPDATCWVDADATELLAARRAMNAAADAPDVAAAGAASAVGASASRPPVSLLALLARVCTAALARFPELNATVRGREIVRLPAVHLGFAAQTDRGLVVPVVRDAHRLSAEELSAELARLTEAARSGTLTPAELTGGTFTLNNYGVFGVDGSTPILNHPEAGMLGVGRIAEKPWVHEGELAVRRVVQLSFTFDHRVCDGGTAGGFLRYVADCVEQPALLLRTL